MAARTVSQRILLSLSLFALIFISLIPTLVKTDTGNVTILLDYSSFIKNVSNGNAGELRGIYVMGAMAMPVVQQPADNAGFISSVDETVTQFGMVNQFGNIGLLAHNNLAGKNFFSLTLGQLVLLVYGNGKVSAFIITQVLRYQAYEPSNPKSYFRNLDNGIEYSAKDVFRQVYMGARHITLQTCITEKGEASWGRLFVIAIPLTQYFDFARQNLATTN
jgi:hypothetical protein